MSIYAKKSKKLNFAQLISWTKLLKKKIKVVKMKASKTFCNKFRWTSILKYQKKTLESK